METADQSHEHNLLLHQSLFIYSDVFPSPLFALTLSPKSKITTSERK